MNSRAEALEDEIKELVRKHGQGLKTPLCVGIVQLPYKVGYEANRKLEKLLMLIRMYMSEVIYEKAV